MPNGAAERTALRLPRASALSATDAPSRLVFRLARGASSPVTPIEVDAVADWGRALQLASDENAVIALRDHLRSEKWGAVPSDTQRYLAMLALDREFRMRLLATRLEESLAALNAAGIEVMLLKGGALASTLYRSFAARPMRDVDLLVRPDRAQEARALMVDLGWGADPDLPGDQSYSTHHHLSPLLDTGTSRLRLELHRALAPHGHPFRFSEEEIWSEARIAKIGQAHALVMHPVHHAAHIAIHFAWSHMLKMGAWHAFRDLAALADARLIDWNDLVHVAARWGASTCCYWTLQLGVLLADLSVPDAVISRLRPRLPDIVHVPLERHFVNGILRSNRGCPSVRLDQALWALAMRPQHDGHGSTRPWSVSEKLNVARSERAGIASDRFPRSTFRQLRRSARYLSNIVV